MVSKDKDEPIKDNKGERFHNTVSTPILDIMRQQHSRNKNKELQKPDENTNSRRSLFNKRKK